MSIYNCPECDTELGRECFEWFNGATEAGTDCFRVHAECPHCGWDNHSEVHWGYIEDEEEGIEAIDAYAKSLRDEARDLAAKSGDECALSNMLEAGCRTIYNHILETDKFRAPEPVDLDLDDSHYVNSIDEHTWNTAVLVPLDDGNILPSKMTPPPRNFRILEFCHRHSMADRVRLPHDGACGPWRFGASYLIGEPYRDGEPLDDQRMKQEAISYMHTFPTRLVRILDGTRTKILFDATDDYDPRPLPNTPTTHTTTPASPDTPSDSA